jgi:hypothetical protein
MGMVKNYLLELICLCSDQEFGQDAVEWAIINEHIKLKYRLEEDLRLIMGEPGKPETGIYSTLVCAYQAHLQQNTATLVDSYQPLLEEINRSVPLAA